MHSYREFLNRERNRSLIRRALEPQWLGELFSSVEDDHYWVKY
jgi:hypothetical protein